MNWNEIFNIAEQFRVNKPFIYKMLNNFDINSKVFRYKN